MNLNEFWLNLNNGQKEALNNVKHGVRINQLDTKHASLFNVFDVNKDGVLENEEVSFITSWVKAAAGIDDDKNTISGTENIIASKEIAKQFNIDDIENTDLVEFIKAISDADADIIGVEEKIIGYPPEPGSETGERIIKTSYKDGTTETIYLYPNGDFKKKVTVKPITASEAYYTIGEDERRFSQAQLENTLKQRYKQILEQTYGKNGLSPENKNKLPYSEFKKRVINKFNIIKHTEDIKTEYSSRYQTEENASNISKRLYSILLDSNDALSQDNFKNLLNEINDQNVLSVLQAFEKNFSNKNLLELITSQLINNDKEMEEVLIGENGIFSKLIHYAQSVGLSNDAIKGYQNAFNSELKNVLSGITISPDSGKLNGILSALMNSIELYKENPELADIANSNSYQETVEYEQSQKRATVHYTRELVSQARTLLESHLEFIKENMVKSFGEIALEDIRFYLMENPILKPFASAANSLAEKAGFDIDAFTKSIYTKIDELKDLEAELTQLENQSVNSRDFEAKYKELLGTDYMPESMNALTNLSMNPPWRNDPKYIEYRQKVNTLTLEYRDGKYDINEYLNKLKDIPAYKPDTETKQYKQYQQKLEQIMQGIAGKSFTDNVTRYITQSGTIGSAIEMALFIACTMGLGTTAAGAGWTARAASGAKVFAGYSAARGALNFTDDALKLTGISDSLGLTDTKSFEEYLGDRQNLTFGGALIGENNAENFKKSLIVIKNWAVGKISLEQAKNEFSNIKGFSFDDFVTSTGGQLVINTATSAVFGAVMGAASTTIEKIGEAGAKLGQKLGMELPQLSKVGIEILEKNPEGISGVEFLTQVAIKTHAQNAAAIGAKFVAETALFFGTNLSMSVVQEILSESNTELEDAWAKGPKEFSKYLVARLGQEAVNLLQVKSIGMIVAMMMGMNQASVIRENYSEFETMKNVTVRLEEVSGMEGMPDGKCITVEGPNGKLYVQGSLMKFYNQNGLQIQQELNSAQGTEFENMDAVSKTISLLNTYMAYENILKAPENPLSNISDQKLIDNTIHISEETGVNEGGKEGINEGVNAADPTDIKPTVPARAVVHSTASKPTETVLPTSNKPISSSITLPKTPDEMIKAINDAKDWHSLRKLSKGMKGMPKEVLKLYVDRENQLRTELSAFDKSVENWDKNTHFAITEQALEGYDFIPQNLKRYIARASELPDLNPRELVDFISPHFYDVLNEDPSYGTIDDEHNNALSRYMTYTQKAIECGKAGDLDGYLKAVGYALHYLQDGGTPPHTEHGNYAHKLYRLPMHILFERGPKIGANARLPELQKNYKPEEIPFSSFEMLFHNTALFTAQPENHVSYNNIREWPGIQQTCYDRGMNVTRTYLDQILQYMPESGKITPQESSEVSTLEEFSQAAFKPGFENNAKSFLHEITDTAVSLQNEIQNLAIVSGKSTVDLSKSTGKELINELDNILGTNGQNIEDLKVATVSDNGVCIIKKLNSPRYIVETPGDNIYGLKSRITYDNEGNIIEAIKIEVNPDKSTTRKRICFKNNKPVSISEINSKNSQIKHNTIDIENGTVDNTTTTQTEDESIQVRTTNDKKALSKYPEAISLTTHKITADSKYIFLDIYEFADGTKTTVETNSFDSNVIEILKDGTARINGKDVPVEDAKQVSQFENFKQQTETKIKTYQEQQYTDKIPSGYVIDAQTHQPIEVNPDKIVTDIHYAKNQSSKIELKDENGNVLGYVEFYANDEKLFISALGSYADGLGIGTQLIKEIIKIGEQEGLNIEGFASYAPGYGSAQKSASNLKFYYKMGFRATDPGADKLIQECIDKNLDTPISLNAVGIKYQTNAAPKTEPILGQRPELQNRITDTEVLRKSKDNAKAITKMTSKIPLESRELGISVKLNELKGEELTNVLNIILLHKGTETKDNIFAFLDDGTCVSLNLHDNSISVEIPANNPFGIDRRLKYDEQGNLLRVERVFKDDDGIYTLVDINCKNDKIHSVTKEIYQNGESLGWVRDEFGVVNARLDLSEKPTEQGPAVNVPSGWVLDVNTGLPVEVDINKIQIDQIGDERGGHITIKDEFGNELGQVGYGISDSAKDIYFHTFESSVDGLGIGTKLINELKKIADEKGYTLSADADFSPMMGGGTNKPASNLKFYYKMGFRAEDEGIDQLVKECIKKGYDIPVSVNKDVRIKYVKEAGEQTNTPSTILQELQSYISEYTEHGENASLEIKEPKTVFQEYFKHKADLAAKINSAGKIFNPKTGYTTDSYVKVLNDIKNFITEKSSLGTIEDYNAVVEEISKLMPEFVKSNFPDIRPEIAENADKLYKWQAYCSGQKSGGKDVSGQYSVVTDKFFDKQKQQQAVKEFTEFLENMTGKRVIVGEDSLFDTIIDLSVIFNNPDTYKDVDYIVLGHGTGSSLITDTSNPDTWRFKYSGQPVWEFIADNIPEGKQALMLVCENDGRSADERADLPEMKDKNGKYMAGIGASANGIKQTPLKICTGGIKHITGDVSVSSYSQPKPFLSGVYKGKVTTTKYDIDTENYKISDNKSDAEKLHEMLAEKGKSYELSWDDAEENFIITVSVAGARPNPAAGVPFTYEIYHFDKDGNQIGETLTGLSEKEAKKHKLDNYQLVDNSKTDTSGTTNILIAPIPKKFINWLKSGTSINKSAAVSRPTPARQSNIIHKSNPAPAPKKHVDIEFKPDETDDYKFTLKEFEADLLGNNLCPYRTITDKKGNTYVEITKSYVSGFGNHDHIYNIYKYDKDGNFAGLAESVPEEAAKMFYKKNSCSNPVHKGTWNDDFWNFEKLGDENSESIASFEISAVKYKGELSPAQLTASAKEIDAKISQTEPQEGNILSRLSNAAKLKYAKGKLFAMKRSYCKWTPEEIEILAPYYIQDPKAVQEVFDRYGYDCFSGAKEVDLAVLNVKTHGAVSELAELETTNTYHEVVRLHNGKSIKAIAALCLETDGLAMEFARIPYHISKKDPTFKHDGPGAGTIKDLCDLSLKYGKAIVLKYAQIRHIDERYGGSDTSYIGSRDIERLLQLGETYGHDLIYEIARKTHGQVGQIEGYVKLNEESHGLFLDLISGEMEYQQEYDCSYQSSDGVNNWKILLELASKDETSKQAVKELMNFRDENGKMKFSAKDIKFLMEKGLYPLYKDALTELVNKNNEEVPKGQKKERIYKFNPATILESYAKYKDTLVELSQISVHKKGSYYNDAEAFSATDLQEIIPLWVKNPEAGEQILSQLFKKKGDSSYENFSNQSNDVLVRRFKQWLKLNDETNGGVLKSGILQVPIAEPKDYETAVRTYAKDTETAQEVIRLRNVEFRDLDDKLVELYKAYTEDFKFLERNDAKVETIKEILTSGLYQNNREIFAAILECNPNAVNVINEEVIEAYKKDSESMLKLLKNKIDPRNAAELINKDFFENNKTEIFDIIENLKDPDRRPDDYRGIYRINPAKIDKMLVELYKSDKDAFEALMARLDKGYSGDNLILLTDILSSKLYQKNKTEFLQLLDMDEFYISQTPEKDDELPYELKDMYHTGGKSHFNIITQELINYFKENGIVMTAMTAGKPGEKAADQRIEYCKLMGTTHEAVVEKLKNIESKMMQNPVLYVNGDFNNAHQMRHEIIETISDRLDKMYMGLYKLAAVYDKEALDALMRMRLDDVEEYTDSALHMSDDDLVLLHNLSQACNVDGKPFLPKQKIDLMDLLEAFNECGVDKTPIQEMLKPDENGIVKIDIPKLNRILLDRVMKDCGMSQEQINAIPTEILMGWDLKNIHLLAREVQDPPTGDDRDAQIFFMQAANSPDFIQQITGLRTNAGKLRGTPYGDLVKDTNAITETEFGQIKANYDVWINTPKELEITFQTKDAATTELSNISATVTKYLTGSEGSIRSKIGKMFDKRFSQYIKDGKFAIPQEIAGNQQKLIEFIEQLLPAQEGQPPHILDDMWSRAQANLSNPDKAEKAQNTLTIQFHIREELERLKGIKSQDGEKVKAQKSLDLTVGTWGRNPQKDVFQGNLTTCCIGMNEFNGHAMFHYLMSTAFNFITVTDNTTGEVIGNGLCYMVKNKNGEPYFIIDNIEIRNGAKPSSDACRQIRQQMTNYAARVAKAMTGRDDIKIFMSNHYNDVPTGDLKRTEEVVEFIGDCTRDRIYADLYGGWSNIQIPQKCELLRLVPDKGVTDDVIPPSKAEPVKTNEASVDIGFAPRIKTDDTLRNDSELDFVELNAKLADAHKSYELYSDKDGENVVIIVPIAGERPNPAAGVPFTYDVYRFDKNGNQTSEPIKGLSEKEAKQYELENHESIDHSVTDTSGTLNSFVVPVPSFAKRFYNRVKNKVSDIYIKIKSGKKVSAEPPELKPSPIEPKVFPHLVTTGLNTYGIYKDNGMGYPYFDYDNGLFSKEAKAVSMKKETPSPDEKIIHVDQMTAETTIAGSSTLDQTLYTDQLLQCAALTVVDKAHNKQTLIHVYPGHSIEDNKQIIEYILSQSDPKDLELSVVNGVYETTTYTVQFILDTLKELVPDVKVKLFNFDKDLKVFNRGLLLKDGKLSCCDTDDVTNKVINPKDHVTYLDSTASETVPTEGAKEVDLTQALSETPFASKLDDTAMEQWAKDNGLEINSFNRRTVFEFIEPGTGNIVRRITKDWDDSTLVYDDRRFFYDENGNQIGEITKYTDQAFPTYSYDYPKNGLPQKRAIKLADGLWHNDMSEEKELLPTNPITGKPQTAVKTDTLVQSVHSLTEPSVVQQPKQLSEKEIKKIQKELKSICDKYKWNVSYGNVVSGFDYANAEIHIKNLQSILKYKRASISENIIRNGYFTSKEGAEALDYLLKTFDTTDDGNHAPQAIDFAMNLRPEHVLNIKKRGLEKIGDDTRIRNLARLSDEEYAKLLSSPLQDKLTYISDNEIVNEFLLLFSGGNSVQEAKHIEQFVLQQIQEHPNDMDEHIEFLKQMVTDTDGHLYKIKDMYKNPKDLENYKKAYNYLKDSGVKGAKIVLVDPKKNNIYDAGGVFSIWGHIYKQECDLFVFDTDGNFIRRITADDTDSSINEVVVTPDSQIDYQASITTNERGIRILNTSTSKIYGKDGKLSYIETYEASKDVPNKFDIYREYPNAKRYKMVEVKNDKGEVIGAKKVESPQRGVKYKVGIAEQTPSGEITIEKNLKHKNGDTTQYVYIESPNGSRLTNTVIKDKNGKVKTEHKFEYKVIDENHFKTIENGVEYDIEYKDSKVIVTRDDGEKVTVGIGSNDISKYPILTKLFGNVLSKDLLPVLKQMPGSFYFDIEKYNLTKIGKEINNVNENNAHYDPDKNLIAISKEWSESMFTLAHEFGHFKIKNLKIQKKQKIVDSFLKEVGELNRKLPNFVPNSMRYLISVNSRNDSYEKSLEELACDIHALMYASNINPDIELRSQFIQEYLPETFALITEEFKTAEGAEQSNQEEYAIAAGDEDMSIKEGMLSDIKDAAKRIKSKVSSMIHSDPLSEPESSDPSYRYHHTNDLDKLFTNSSDVKTQTDGSKIEAAINEDGIKVERFSTPNGRIDHYRLSVEFGERIIEIITDKDGNHVRNNILSDKELQKNDRKFDNLIQKLGDIKYGREPIETLPSEEEFIEIYLDEAEKQIKDWYDPTVRNYGFISRLRPEFIRDFKQLSARAGKKLSEHIEVLSKISDNLNLTFLQGESDAGYKHVSMHNKILDVLPREEVFVQKFIKGVDDAKSMQELLELEQDLKLYKEKINAKSYEYKDLIQKLNDKKSQIEKGIKDGSLNTTKLSPKKILKIKAEVQEVLKMNGWNSWEGYMPEDFWDKFDYENADIHIKHMKQLTKYDYSNGFKDVCEGGYFYSLEGAKAFDELKKIFPIKERKNNLRTDFDMYSSQLSVDQFYIAQKRDLFRLQNVLNQDKMKDVTMWSDEQFEKYKHFAEKGITYISSNEKINELFLNIANKDVNSTYELKCIEGRIIELTKDNPDLLEKLIEGISSLEEKLAIINFPSYVNKLGAENYFKYADFIAKGCVYLFDFGDRLEMISTLNQLQKIKQENGKPNYNWEVDAKEAVDRLRQNALKNPEMFVNDSELSTASAENLIRQFIKNNTIDSNISSLNSVLSKYAASEGEELNADFLDENKDVINLIKEFYNQNLKAIVEYTDKNNVEGLNQLIDDFFADKKSNESKQGINEFFDKNHLELMILSTSFDKETLDVLMRKRLGDAEEYLDIIEHFSVEEMQLLERLANSYNIDGQSPFGPNTKVEFIDLINAYRQNKLDTQKMENMIQEGRVDVGKLHKDLFEQIMLNCGISQEELDSTPLETLMNWDLKYVHLLAKEMQDPDAREDLTALIRAANSGNFEEFITNPTNMYGKANSVTKAIFATSRMNFNAWTNPDKKLEMNYKFIDGNTKAIQDIRDQLIEDINMLRYSSEDDIDASTGKRKTRPTKGVIEPILKSLIPDFDKDKENFDIPEKYLKDKHSLLKFVQDILSHPSIQKMKERATQNKDNPKFMAAATRTITALSHLETKVDGIKALKEGKTKKSYDLTIKMWDRDPFKDIYAGNRSTCCIGMGAGNGRAMTIFVLNKSYNMIQIMDNISGKEIGNALCYFVKDSNGKPMFIIDNIEINNAHKLSPEVGAELRDNMAEYARRIALSVTGRDDIPVYMSSHYNDVPINDLKTETKTITFLGDVSSPDIYMDLYDGWVSTSNLTKKVALLRIK